MYQENINNKEKDMKQKHGKASDWCLLKHFLNHHITPKWAIFQAKCSNLGRNSAVAVTEGLLCSVLFSHWKYAQNINFTDTFHHLSCKIEGFSVLTYTELTS